MTRAELQRLFPNASLSCFKLNSDPEDVGGLQNTITEPIVRKSTSLENESKERGTSRPSLRVTITSYRCRLLDADNLCPKFLIDALRYEQLIPDDSPDHIILEVRQQKVDGKAKEGTLVEITPCP